MKKFLLSLLMFASIYPMYSDDRYDFIHDGIFYKKTSPSTCEVVFVSDNFWPGPTPEYVGIVNLKIPAIVNVHYSVTGIGEKAFYACSYLEEVELPNTLEYIDHEAFWNCSQLRKINLPNSLRKIGSEAFCGTRMSSVVIPSSVDSIYWGAFDGMSLDSITLKGSLPYAGYYIVGGGGHVETVILEEEVEFVHGCFFDNGYNYEYDEIVSKNPTPPQITEPSPWHEFYHTKVLKVPATAINKYRNTDPWSACENIVPYNSVFSGSGDADGDGETTINDVVAIIAYVLGKDIDISFEAADVNEDGEIDINDIVQIINIMLNQ